MCKCCPSIYRPALPNNATIVAYDVDSGEKVYASDRGTSSASTSPSIPNNMSLMSGLDWRGHVWEMGLSQGSSGSVSHGRRLLSNLVSEREQQVVNDTTGKYARELVGGDFSDSGSQQICYWYQRPSASPVHLFLFYDVSGSTMSLAATCAPSSANAYVPFKVKDWSAQEVFATNNWLFSSTTGYVSPSSTTQASISFLDAGGSNPSSYAAHSTGAEFRVDDAAASWIAKATNGSGHVCLTQHDLATGRRTGEVTLHTNTNDYQWNTTAADTGASTQAGLRSSSRAQGGGTLRQMFHFPGGNGFNSYANGTQVVTQFILFDGLTEVWRIDWNTRTYAGSSSSFSDSCSATNTARYFYGDWLQLEGQSSTATGNVTEEHWERIARDSIRTYIPYLAYNSSDTVNSPSVHRQGMVAVNNDGTIAWDVDLGVSSTATLTGGIGNSYPNLIQGFRSTGDVLLCIGYWRDGGGDYQVGGIDPATGSWLWKSTFTTQNNVNLPFRRPRHMRLNSAQNVLYVTGPRGGI